MIQPITCAWCGRHEDNIEVFGASSKSEARQHAMKLFEKDCAEPGLTLNDGHHSVWKYDDPQPADWKNSYIFKTVDEHPVDQREWWEK